MLLLSLCCGPRRRKVYRIDNGVTLDVYRMFTNNVFKQIIGDTELLGNLSQLSDYINL